MSIGTGSTRDGGLSSFVQAENMRRNRKSCLPDLSSRGSLDPMLGNFWLTRRMASSTERDWFGSLLGEMRPSRHRRPKVWRSVTGSAICETLGFALMEVQNVHQMSHAFWAFRSREGTTPAVTVFLSKQEISAECISGHRWSIVHNFGCGYLRLK